MHFLSGFLASAFLAEARVVTVHQVVTRDPTTIHEYQAPDIVTDRQTNWVSETIFQATTIVTTVPTGVVLTDPVSSKPNPVTQFSTYTTSELTESINPSTYTKPFTVETPTTTLSQTQRTATPILETNAPSSSSQEISSSSTSTPVAKTTSLEGGSSFVGSSLLSSVAGSVLSSSLSTNNGAPTTSTSTTSSEEASTSSISSSSSSSSSSAPPPPQVSNVYSGPIFDAISTEEPLSIFPREDIPFTVPNGYDRSQIMQTNKFYDNFLLDNQDLTAFAQPYQVFYSTDKDYYGVGIGYTTKSQRVFGPDPNANPVEYYTNPLKLKSIVLSAKEFTNYDLNNPTVEAQGPFSVNMSLTTKGAWPNQRLTVPVAIGMGFVTGIYDGYTPRLFSQVGFRKILKSKHEGSFHSGLDKYVVTLRSGVQWNVYVKAPEGFEFKAVNDFEVMGNFAASGADSIVVQVAVIESNEDKIDSAAGAFPVGAELEGETNGATTTYRIAYDVRGESTSGTTLLYALPHHVESLTGTSRAGLIPDLTVYSTNKGYLTGVLSNTLEMSEDVSHSPGWLAGSPGTLSADSLKILASTVNDELSEDMHGQTNTASTYTAGKAFDKFAYVLLVASEILQNEKTSKEGLSKLKQALDPWLSNNQPTPFIYDTLCKGITSSAANKPGGSPMDDFGAPFYNDHHFHYGYYVHTAAVIGLLDKKYGDGSWVEKNKEWVNSLVRDVANPSSEDPYFPVSRMFDYFSGHSWAHGLFASGDGKDEESTSEDYNFAYGMKLWGEIIGDNEMVARGDLMLAIMKRTMNLYFLFKDDNDIQPKNIIGNRVAGITFENKLDHTTYFGTNLEYIQGIHMIPLTPASVSIRERDFVQQEWDSLLAPIVGSLDSGWAGILRANQALFDPKTSYDYFTSPNFKSNYLDGGASRSWYIAFSGLLGGSP